MDSINVEWHSGDENDDINQMYSNGLEYAFCSAANKQCCPFIFCKDFLHDCVWGQLHKKRTSIYGFSWAPKTDPPICLTQSRILITNSADREFGNKIGNCVKFLNYLEKQLKLLPTKALVCENPLKKYKKCGIFLLEGSRRWLEAPPMLSLYTLIMRTGFTYDGKSDFMKHIKKIQDGELPPYQEEDRSYLTQAQKGLDKILSLGYRKIFYVDPKSNYPAKITVNNLHHRTGIVALSTGTSVVPHWNRPSLMKAKASKSSKSKSAKETSK